MIGLSLETKLYKNKNAPTTLHEARDYFERAYLVNAIEQNVWYKENGAPIPHGGIYIDQLARSMSTSRKNASYLINQKYELKPLVEYYHCERSAKIPSNIQELTSYKTINRIISQFVASVQDDVTKRYGYFLSKDKVDEVSQTVTTKYLHDILPTLPKAAKIDYITNYVLEQKLPLTEAKKEFEKQWVTEHKDKPLNEAANALGISPRHLRRLTKSLHHHTAQTDNV